MPAQKNILLSLCGHTPQILTETLYGMMVGAEEPVRVDEVWVVTTKSGKEKVCSQLLDRKEGKFYQFCHDYSRDPDSIRFSIDHVLAPDDLSDIQNVHDNESFANVLTERVWHLTQDPQTTLYCSIAGGRKTMSAYMAMIMQFFARPQDRLMHVIVNPSEFENTTDFYYPPPTHADILTRDGQTVNTENAKLVLVDIPFIRLRDKIVEFQQQYYSFSEMVRIAQKWIANPTNPPVLNLNTKEECLYVGTEYKIKLTSLRFALYRLLAENSLNRPDSIDVDDFESYFIRAGNNMPNEAIKRLTELSYRYGLYKKDEFIAKVQQERARANKAIKDAMGHSPFLEFILISTVGGYGERKYGIKLDKDFIRIE